VSLLLDALRRAAAAKQGPAAEQYTVPRRSASAPTASAAGTRPGEDDLAGMDEQPLELAPRAGDAEAGTPAAAARAGARADSPRRTAEAVLRQGRRRRPGGARVVLVAAAVLALAVVALGVGGWYYYRTVQTDISRDLAAYRPAPGLAGAAPAGPSDAAPATSASGPEASPEASAGAGDSANTGRVAARDASAPASQAASAGSAPARSPQVSDAEVAQPAAAAAGAKPAPEPAPAGPAATSPKPTPAPASKRPPDAQKAGDKTEGADQRKQATAPASSDSDTASAEPRRRARPIVQSGGPAPLAEALQAGYRALQAGRLGDAETAYGRARSLAPDNRDALLGAAAVAQRRGDVGTARRLYAQVLADRPRDPYARAAMAELDGTGNPRRSETELKMLLHDQPDSAPLHFALGNVYAAESDWSGAQEAYFEAVRSDPDNPDYAYNLAVALDHLGQGAPARRYYEQALQLAGKRAGGFPVAAVRRRIEQLR